MSGEGIGKEVMPKNLQHEERALNKRAVAREKIVIPDKFTRERWRSDDDADDQEQERAQPSRAEKLDETRREFQCAECGAD